MGRGHFGSMWVCLAHPFSNAESHPTSRGAEIVTVIFVGCIPTFPKLYKYIRDTCKVNSRKISSNTNLHEENGV